MDGFILSEHYSADFSISDSIGYISQLSFDADSTILYSVTGYPVNGIFDRRLRRSNNFGKQGSWESISLPDEINKVQYLVSDPEVSGTIYFADSNAVYKSSNFGENFEMVLESNLRIKGLYHKPNSETFYLLTTDELFEANNGVIKSLKKLPVSIDEEFEVPISIKLHQNYPNPFNPSTTISFELDKAALVSLTIFDALGKTVATLVNEPKSTGIHRVNFDASNLSSGIYFYRLQSGDFIETRKLTLIK